MWCSAAAVRLYVYVYVTTLSTLERTFFAILSSSPFSHLSSSLPFLLTRSYSPPTPIHSLLLHLLQFLVLFPLEECCMILCFMGLALTINITASVTASITDMRLLMKAPPSSSSCSAHNSEVLRHSILSDLTTLYLTLPLSSSALHALSLSLCIALF